MKIEAFVKTGFLALFLVLLTSLIFLSSCTSYPPSPSESNFEADALKICCEECVNQAERDPSGYDISIKPCGEYELSESCERFFEKENSLVGECRKK